MDESLTARFAAALRAGMERMGIGQGELGRRAGIPQPQISYYLNRPGVPRMKELFAIAREVPEVRDFIEELIVLSEPSGS